MHKDSEKLLVELLNIMANCDKEEDFYKWYKLHRSRFQNIYAAGF